MTKEITYRVEIREVWISTREVTMPEGTPQETIIQTAIDQENEADFEYVHTMGSENHTVRALP